MIYTVYVVMLDEKYLKFGSYCKATIVSNPLYATHYSKPYLANRRINSYQTYPGLWIDGKSIVNPNLIIKELVFHLIDTREVK